MTYGRHIHVLDNSVITGHTGMGVTSLFVAMGITTIITLSSCIT